MDDGTYYAAADLGAGAESYHGIDIDTVCLRTRGSRKVGWHTAAITSSAMAKPLPEKLYSSIPKEKMKSGSWKQRKLRSVVKSWCGKNRVFL